MSEDLFYYLPPGSLLNSDGLGFSRIGGYRVGLLRVVFPAIGTSVDTVPKGVLEPKSRALDPHNLGKPCRTDMAAWCFVRTRSMGGIDRQA